MFKSLRVRAVAGDAVHRRPARGRARRVSRPPVIADGAVRRAAAAPAEASCPTQAIALDPVRIDLGRCVFCNECVAACPDEKIAFTPEPRMGARDARGSRRRARRDGAVAASRRPRRFAKLFGRSLKLRQVSAGGCNGCELELNALANVNFDLQRYGIEWVASPRHADALVLSGPLTRNMAEAVQLAWDAMPEPRFVVAVGACAISGGLYAGSPVSTAPFWVDSPRRSTCPAARRTRSPSSTPSSISSGSQERDAADGA